MDCVCPPPLCCSAIGETPKKQQFLRRRVKKQLNRLLTKLNLSVTHVTPPLYLALQNTGEEFQIPTPKRYVIICCSKYRYSHFSKKIKVECEMSYDVVRVGGGDWKCRFEQPFISLELWGYSPSPLCCEVNRGNARRAKGLNPQSKILWNLF